MTTPTTSVPRSPAPDGEHTQGTGGPHWRAVLRRRWWVIAAALALVVLAVAVVATRVGDDDATAPTTSAAVPTTVSPTSAPTPTPTVTPTAPPTTGPPPTTVPGDDLSIALWPTAASGYHFTDPLALTGEFAREYLGFTDPVVGPFRQGDTRSGEVDIVAGNVGPLTTAMVRQLGSPGYWYVLSAGTDTIAVTMPGWNATITSPVAVAGQAHAFEGVVNVEVRRDDQRAPAGQSVVTGGGDEKRPFTGSITWAAPAGPGALVFVERSARDGSVLKATVVRVQLGASH